MWETALASEGLVYNGEVMGIIMLTPVASQRYDSFAVYLTIILLLVRIADSY
jgi:hypothetical protein